jgi:hypothetical protein
MVLHEINQALLAPTLPSSLKLIIILFSPSNFIMSCPTVQAIRASKSPFVPSKPKIFSIGRTSVSVYPKVDSSMTDPKKAMAYQHNKTTLASTDLDQQACVLTLADRLDLMLTVESSQSDWEQELSQNWASFQYLTISWHDTKGAAIASTMTVGDSSILLSVQDGNLADCCTAGIKFVHVQLELDSRTWQFAVALNAILQGEYYIQLPQRSVDLVNGSHINYKLTTWLGASDLHVLSPMEVKRSILDITHQDGPFNLLVPSFNLSSCRTDSTTVYGEIKLSVVHLASDTIHQTPFPSNHITS